MNTMPIIAVDLSTIAFAVEGPAYSSESETHVAYCPQSLYLVGTDGVIAAVLTPDDPQYHAIRAELARLNRLTSLADGQVLLPGFSDLHLHAPQWAQAGAALDEPLERWLGRYTFPTEARFADLAYADRAHRHLVQATLARGTTSVLYYDTIDRAAAVNLAHVCAELGQRGFIGKVVMDDPESNPEYYREDTATALAETERFITRCASSHLTAVLTRHLRSSNRSSPRGSSPAAPTRLWRGWASWRPATIVSPNRTVRKAIGSTTRCSSAMGGRTPKRSTCSAC